MLTIVHAAVLVLAVVGFLCYAMHALYYGEVRRIATRQRLEEQRQTKRIEDPKSA